MITFIIGLVILFVGAALYGKFCEKVFGPDERKTPAYTKEDGVDSVSYTHIDVYKRQVYFSQNGRTLCHVRYSNDHEERGNPRNLSDG